MLDTGSEGHDQIRAVLRFLGPAVAIVGILFFAVGIGSFFSSFGSHGPPQQFWCAFVGLPLIGIGVMISKFGYMGAVARYMSREVSPVATDTVNYVAHGTKDAVREVAAAVGEGLRGAGRQPAAAGGVRCSKCDAENDRNASFCKACGTGILQAVGCSACGELNDPDARFCDNCGRALSR